MISIVVPVYNSSSTIKRCVDSVLAQSYADFELILVNDGSTDDSLKIIQELGKVDDRIVVVNKENGGVSSARNLGMSKATREYIIFVDSDDELYEDALQNLYSNVSGYDMVVGSFSKKSIVGYSQNLILDDREVDVSDIPSAFYNNFDHFSGPWGKIFTTDIIRNNGLSFRTDMKYSEDCEFVTRYLLYSGKIKLISSLVYVYYVGDAGACGRYYDDLSEFLEKDFHSKLALVDKCCPGDKDIISKFAMRSYNLANTKYADSNISIVELAKKIDVTSSFYKNYADINVGEGDWSLNMAKKYRKDLKASKFRIKVKHMIQKVFVSVGVKNG
ncbi:MAG: glycosyltransferase family 2 protein [Saccharofermentans sp.]|nr:glycosyltransferase family 2 protein [Saccharofermentans sp.]